MFSCYSYLTNCRADGGASPSPPAGSRGGGRGSKGLDGAVDANPRGLGHKARPWQGCSAPETGGPSAYSQ